MSARDKGNLQKKTQQQQQHEQNIEVDDEQADRHTKGKIRCCCRSNDNDNITTTVTRKKRMERTKKSGEGQVRGQVGKKHCQLRSGREVIRRHARVFGGRGGGGGVVTSAEGRSGDKQTPTCTFFGISKGRTGAA